VLLLGLNENICQNSYAALLHFAARKIIQQGRPGFLLQSTDGEISSDPLRKELVTLFAQLEIHISIYDQDTVPSHLRLSASGFEGMEAGLKP
jgi:hypothetical protein